MSNREIALGNEILRGVVGSTSHGTAIEGQDDRDEMAVFVEPPANVCGLTPCEHYIHRDQPEGVRSQPGDLDLTMYSLRKYCRLAAQGNPSVMILLWLPAYITRTEIGSDLVAMREAFISREAGSRFLGYLVAQKMRLTGERARTVNRPELVARYGYDTKFAMHALRLGLQGIELLEARRLTLPVAEPNISTLRAVRGGEPRLPEVLRLIEDAEARLRALIETCAWRADIEGINRFMVRAHAAHWAAR
jgi:predicted nucleotidyltransferase